MRSQNGFYHFDNSKIFCYTVRVMEDTCTNEVQNENFIYDLFIAYHGTNNPNGSYKVAKGIATFLTTLNYKVYLHQFTYDKAHPSHKDTPYDCTWERIMESRCFLLVVNDDVPRKKNKSLGNEEQGGKPLSQLRDEVDRFYNLVTNGKRSKMDFNWGYYGATKKIEDQKAFLQELFPPLTDGNNTLLLGDFSDSKICEWLRFRLDETEEVFETKETPQAEEDYIPPYSREPFFCIIEADDFASAHTRSLDFIKRGEKNLVVNLSLKKADFFNPFYDENAFEKAKILRGTSKDRRDKSKHEFTLYHGDYIILRDGSETKDGYAHIVNELINKSSSRRAILSLLSTKDIVGSGNKSIPSFLFAQYQIVNRDLIVSEYFRAMDIKEFMPINFAEAYILIGEVIKNISEIKRIFLSVHIFDAYVSQSKQLYVPLMDKEKASIKIIPALTLKDNETIIALLKDKLESRVYHYTKGMKEILSYFEEYQEENSNEIIEVLEKIIDYGERLEDLYGKSNDPQEDMLAQVDKLIKELINYFEKAV